MIDPNSNDLILGSQLSRHHDLLPHLVRSERQGQAVIHHLNPPISPEGKLYTLSPEDQDLKIVFRAMSDGSGFYPYDVHGQRHLRNHCRRVHRGTAQINQRYTVWLWFTTSFCRKCDRF